ncbi:MAG TPA: carboxy terminal-processing peptidase [Polyangiaceae bacterium]|nr:carboxy terminal-processing peptidase [Polyangiaceae bacterium]
MNRTTRTTSFILAVLAAIALAVIGRTARFPRASAARDTTEANITRLTSDVLGRSQFSHHPLDRELSKKFLDGYLDAMDATRSLFLQSDVAEFQKYEDTLAQATRAEGDTTPARVIFARYLERLGQRNAYVADLLRTKTFDFTGHDVFVVDRAKAPRPANMDAAREQWRKQLRAEYLQEKLSDLSEPEIKKKLTGRYARQLETMKGLGKEDVLETYLNALAHVYDPHSDYLGHEQMESLSISMNLSLFGIGASLESQDGYCTVREVLPGGPAARSGALKPGDHIVAVAQAGKDAVDVVDMPLSKIVELIRGPKGSTVTLTVVSAKAAEGAPRKTVTLVRDEVKLEDQRAKARIIDLPQEDGKTLRLGYIDVPEFYADMSDRGEGTHRSVTTDVARLLGKLKAENVRGVVVDLRRNGGGSLKEAISLTGLFIEKGPVVQTRGATGGVEVDTDPDPHIAYDGPLVLLTSRFSASASEIMAGALQDYGRALIVGDSSTFGKGTVQNILPLARIMDQVGLSHAYDPGALKITIRKFYRPLGASTQLRGVVSDIVLPSVSDFNDVSESALKDPLPWDAVAPASFTRWNRVAPYVATLREKSDKRVAKDEMFTFVRDDVHRVAQSLSTKSVSLNEADRRKELAEEKAKQAEQEKKLTALLAKQPAVYEITADAASAPGLPPPSKIVPGTASSAAPGSQDTTGAVKPHLHNNREIDEDVTLDETMRILADYVRLLPAGAK